MTEDGKKLIKKETYTDQEFTRNLEDEEKRFREKFPPARNFKVASGYFEKLSLLLDDRIASEDRKPELSWAASALKKHSRIWIPVSAVTLVIIGLIIFLPVINTPRQVANAPADSSYNLLDLDESYAHEAVVYEDASLNLELDSSDKDIGLSLSQPSDNDTTLTDADIIDYLSQQDIDPDLLAEL